MKTQIRRGDATKTLSYGKDPQKVQKNFSKAMEQVFKNYPPLPGK